MPETGSCSVQGVRQADPVGPLASAPAGSDSTRTPTVPADPFKESMLGIDHLLESNDEHAESTLLHAKTAITRFITPPARLEFIACRSPEPAVPVQPYEWG